MVLYVDKNWLHSKSKRFCDPIFIMKPKGLPSVINQLKATDFLTKRFGGGICERKEQKRCRNVFLYVVLIFLWTFEIRQLLCYLLIPDNAKEWQTYFGDFTGYYGSNRLYLNLIQMMSGMHAAIVLTFIRFTKDYSWIDKLETNWQKTRFRFKPMEEDDCCHLKFKKSWRELAIVIALIALAYTVGEILFHFNSVRTQSIGYHHYPWIVVMIMRTLLDTVINFTAMSHFVFVCKAITIRFNEIYQDLEFLVEGKVPFDEPILVKFHERHYLVCEMVDTSNKFWKKYLFFFYVIFVPQITIQFYQLLIAPASSLVVKFMFLVSTVGCFLQIIRVSFSASSVVFEAHRPLHLIHGIAVKKWSIEVQNQMILFLQRLNGTFIGYTFMDLFVVTNTLLSSIFTGIFSYFIIIIDMSKN